jgi:hypothetical protein
MYVWYKRKSWAYCLAFLRIGNVYGFLRYADNSSLFFIANSISKGVEFGPFEVFIYEGLSLYLQHLMDTFFHPLREISAFRYYRKGRTRFE